MQDTKMRIFQAGGSISDSEFSGVVCSAESTSLKPTAVPSCEIASWLDWTCHGLECKEDNNCIVSYNILPVLLLVNHSQ